MTYTDILAVAVPTAALTAAVCILTGYAYTRTLHRSLDHARALRGQWYRTAKTLAADFAWGIKPGFADHTTQAIAQSRTDDLDRYVPASPYVPVFDGDRLGYADLAAATRRIGGAS